MREYVGMCVNIGVINLQVYAYAGSDGNIYICICILFLLCIFS